MIDLNAALCHHLFELPIADWIGTYHLTPHRMISRSNWLPLKSIMVAAPVDCSRSAYALSARYQSLRQNPFKSILSALCSFLVMVCILAKGLGDVFHHPHTMTFR